MISDFHRNLLQGGVYYYPGDMSKPQGKIRLLLEAQALAFIAGRRAAMARTGSATCSTFSRTIYTSACRCSSATAGWSKKPKRTSAITIRRGSRSTARIGIAPLIKRRAARLT